MGTCFLDVLGVPEEAVMVASAVSSAVLASGGRRRFHTLVSGGRRSFHSIIPLSSTLEARKETGRYWGFHRNIRLEMWPSWYGNTN